MRLSFDSIDEVKEFVKSLKGARGGKGGDAEDGQPATGNAPPPIQPPAGGFGGSTAAAVFGGFGGPTAATGPDPAVAALVQRIAARYDGAVASGQNNPDAALTWFRSQCGPEAATATMDQIKTLFMPRMSAVQLETIAKQMGA